MDRKAFKQRMQQLKDYREQNPGSTYLNWKQSFVNGGETEEDNDRQKIEKALGPRKDTLPPYQPQRNIIGGPLASGMASQIGDLEDAVNMTPVGDALAVKDMYDAARDNDWLGVGLSALTMIPFVPRTVREFRRTYKGITPKVKVPRVNKKATQDAIDAFAIEQERRAKIIGQQNELARKANNQGYNLVERLQDDPSYLQRAAEVKQRFGDDYSTVYADLIDTYNNAPSGFPKAKMFDGRGTARARMEADPSAIDRHLKGGQFPGITEWNYRIDPNTTNLSGYVTEHEWNHYTDFLKTKTPTADGNSNMFYKMSKDLDGRFVDNNDNYFRRPTEQKAYMNQLREYLFGNDTIKTRNEKVDTKTLTKALQDIKGIDDYKSVVRASEQFRNPRNYTKWFNSIPILGTAGLGMYEYFKLQGDQQDEHNISDISNTEL